MVAVMDALRRVAVVSVFAIAGTGCSPATPIVAAPPPSSPPPVESTIDLSGEWEIRWDRTFVDWQPPIFEGRLSLERRGTGWTGRLGFRQSSWEPIFESLRVEGDHFHIVFRVPSKDGGPPDSDLELSGWIREGRLIGEMRSANIGWSPLSGRRYVPPRPRGTPVGHSLPAFEIEKSVDPAALTALLEHATEEKSTAVVILEGGKIGVEMYRQGYDGAPTVAMSASKSIVSLAVGMLIAEKKLELDTRMGSLFPEWKRLGPKADITVRHLLTHTSGLDPSRANPKKETIREHALKAKLVFSPGARFQYNNAAVDFLAVVVKQAAGVPLDTYLETRLFQKLDIVGAEWMKDTEGTPRGAGELVIRPVDLAKIGQLMLDGGTWRGERLLPAEWVARSVEASQPFGEDCGFLWWREGSFSRVLTEPVLAAWHDAGIEDATLRAARAILGQKYPNRPKYSAALSNAVGTAAIKKIEAALEEGDHIPFSATVSNGPAHGFSARGWLGQQLIVLPKARVVAVRMRSPQQDDYGSQRGEKDAYPGFAEDLSKLFPER